MHPLFQNMHEDLVNKINEIETDSTDTLIRAERCIAIAEQSIERLRNYIQENPFENIPDEINFFKNTKPLFCSYLLYYIRLYNLELRRPAGSIEMHIEHLQTEFLRIKIHFETEADFYHYYRSGATYLDETYFLRGRKNIVAKLHPCYTDADPSFSTGYDYQAAELLADEMLSNYLNKTLHSLKQPPEPAELFPPPSQDKIAWTASTIYLAELIYALYAFAPFSNAKLPVGRIAKYLAGAFNVKIDNIYKKLEEIRMRKKNRTVFLDLLRNSIIRQMEMDDEHAL